MTNSSRDGLAGKLHSLRWLCLGIVALSLQETVAKDAYYSVPISSLTLTEGTLSSNTAPNQARWEHWQMVPALQPYAVLNGPGEAYVGGYREVPWRANRQNSPVRTLYVRAPANQEITGRLFVPKDDWTGMVRVRFKVTPEQSKPDARAAFLAAKEQHYRALLDRNIPGAAWFRYQLEQVEKERGTNGTNRNAAIGNVNRARPTDIEQTYDLFSGGRALSENLQLDRALASLRGTNAGAVALTNLTGITVRPMDWKSMLKEPRPKLDPLAAFIPADQHAIFFPSFHALMEMIDEADANGTPVLQALEPRSEDAGSRTRYQQQLCLGMDELSRLLGPSVVASAALTGSDPYLRVGTDVGVLFEARNLPVLRSSVLARQAAARAAHPGVRAVSGRIDGVRYTGVISADRSVCSYMAAVSNVVFVSNSRKQLETLIRTAQGRQPVLSSQEEYQFFRQRYPLGETNETALLVLSDATIRRWCGPRWRIADSRRTRAAAILADLQAAHADELVRGKARGEVLHTAYGGADLGELKLTPSGVESSVYGTLEFMTPIAELPITTVTSSEARAYERWRDNYQRNWRQFFDPIAVRFSISRQRLAVDLTVMPLILASGYNHIREFAEGSQIDPGGGDPHTNTLARLALAVNSRSAPVQQAGNFVGNMAPGLKANFLSWLGQSVVLYADDDPFWSELGAATNTDTFMEHNYRRLPVALYCEVKNSLGVAAFLTAVHAFADQSAPQMTVWQNLEYHGRPYVKIAPSKLSTGTRPEENWAVYYAVTPDSLTVTLSEKLLKRALDRGISRAGTNHTAVTDLKPWLGKSLGLQMEKKFLDVLLKLVQDDYQAHRQLAAWNNLPILNEWKRLYPDRDPVKVQEQLFGVKLLCPGGGHYVWNEQWQTMESTTLGHPGQPRSATAAALLPGMSDIDLGVTFEKQGLSAKGIIDRTAAE